MKRHLLKILVLPVFLVSAIPVSSQTLQWAKIYGSDKEEYTLNHLKDSKDNIYITGKTAGSVSGENAGLNDGFVMKLDKSGKILWKDQFGTAEEEDVQWSSIDNSGNIYITGFTRGALEGKGSGKEDIFVVKYSPDGKQEWKIQTGTDSTDIAKGICTGKDGYIYVTGLTGGRLGKSSSGKTDCFIMKIDARGNIIMTNQFGTAEDDHGYSIIAGNDNDLFMCGTTGGNLNGKNNGFLDGFSGHFTNNLDLIELSQFGSDGFDIALVLHPDQENNIYIGGSTSGNFAGTQAGEGDCFLFKQDYKGNIIWKKQFGTPRHDGVRGIDVADKLLVSGILNLPPEKAFVHVYNFAGDLLWEKSYETNQAGAGTSGKDVVADKNGFSHLGLTRSSLFGPPAGGGDIYLLKYTWK